MNLKPKNRENRRNNKSQSTNYTRTVYHPDDPLIKSRDLSEYVGGKMKGLIHSTNKACDDVTAEALRFCTASHTVK